MLNAVYDAYQGDEEASAGAVNRGISLMRLQRQDHSIISLWVSDTDLRTITYSLITLVKLARDKDKAFNMIKTAHEKIPPIVIGQVRVYFQAGLARHVTLLETINRDGPGLPRPILICFNMLYSIFYRIWEPWEKCFALQCAEYAIKGTTPDNNFEKIDQIEKEYDELIRSRSISALGTSILAPNLKFTTMQKKELMYRAMLDATLLFAAAVDYRVKHKSYPDSIQELIPEYLAELPKSPIDHKDYIYRAKGDFMEVYALGPEGKHIPATTIIGAESQTQSK
jgi:hypothetical protein